jgi:transposase
VRTDMNEWTEIRRKVLVEGVSKRSIARDYGVGWRTLEKMLANPDPPGYRGAERRPKRKLTAELLEVMDQIFEGDRDAPPKQRHTAKRIFERLRDEHGYTGGITQVQEAVARSRLRSKEAVNTGPKRQRAPVENDSAWLVRSYLETAVSSTGSAPSMISPWAVTAGGPDGSAGAGLGRRRRPLASASR